MNCYVVHTFLLYSKGYCLDYVERKCFTNMPLIHTLIHWWQQATIQVNWGLVSYPRTLRHEPALAAEPQPPIMCSTALKLHLSVTFNTSPTCWMCQGQANFKRVLANMKWFSFCCKFPSNFHCFRVRVSSIVATCAYFWGKMKEIYWQPAGHQIIQKPEGNRAFQTLEQSEMSLTSLVEGAAKADPDLLAERLI